METIPTTNLLNYQIREAVLQDVPYIAQVHLQCWQESYTGLLKQSSLAQRDYRYYYNKYIEKLQNSPDLCLVALNQESMMGFCTATSLKFYDNQCLSQKQEEEIGKCKGEVDNLYVLNKFQRKGVGKALLKQATFWLTTNQLSPFIIWTFKNNWKARSFYVSQGGELLDEALVTIGEEYYTEVAYRFG